jgi:DnaK suppressor protein
MRKDIDLEYYKKWLLDRRDAIMSGREARQRDAQPVELDQTKVGRLSRMDALQQQAMSRATIQRAELELQRITAALNRLNSSGYGYCLRCGED